MAEREPVTRLGRELARLVDDATWDNVGSLDELVDYLKGFTPDELDVLGFVGDRLRLGRGQYGPLDLSTDPRSFAQEQAEEAADLLVYAAARSLAAELQAGWRPSDDRPVDAVYRCPVCRQTERDYHLPHCVAYPAPVRRPPTLRVVDIPPGGAA